jgi:APA family basic amino acid/polyamine antiporter
VRENQRDSGLVRAVGSAALAASIVNMVVGASIFAVPAALAACIGPYAPLAFLGCAVAIGAIAICFAEGGSRVPTSGGAYGYVETAFGPLAGYVAGTLLCFSNVLACGGIAAALADTAASVLPAAFVSAAHAAIIVAVIAGISFVNIGGVARGARLVNAATVLKMIPLAVFLVAGAGAVHAANITRPNPSSDGGLGHALILALFAFTGFETSLCASGEVAQPTRTIPRALGVAMLAVALLYVAVQLVCQGILGPSLAQSSTPLADAMARVSSPLRLLMLAGAALSMFGYIGGDLLGSPRMLFAFGRDGLLPRVLGRVRAGTHAPHVAILCYAALAIVLALTGTFAELAVLSTLAVAAVYMAGCAAAWSLARKRIALAGTPLNFRWLGTAMLVGIGSMLLLLALASTAEILGLLAAGTVSAATYLLVTRRTRRAQSAA